ncbi:unnamed protein product [Urochloa humidicola]
MRKLIRNPNTYSSLIGIIWSLVSYRYTASIAVGLRGVLLHIAIVQCDLRNARGPLHPAGALNNLLPLKSAKLTCSLPKFTLKCLRLHCCKKMY